MVKSRLWLVLALVLTMVTVPVAVAAGEPVLVATLQLNEYCQANGYQGADLRTGTGNHLGPNYAHGNWRCWDADGMHPINMEQACKWQTQSNQVRTFPDNPDDAYTWWCYAVGRQ